MIMDEFDDISKICVNFTSKYKNCLLFINLLHKLLLTDSSNIKQNINIYSNIIASRIGSQTFWKVSKKKLIPFDKSVEFVRSCTYVYMVGKNLYYHKKSTYCNEVKNKSNYDIGFFNIDEIKKDLKHEEIELAKLLIEAFEIQICLDFNINFEKSINFLKKEIKSKFYFDDDSRKNINKLIDLYDSLNIQKKQKGKKIYILQSNYFNLNSTEKIC